MLWPQNAVWEDSVNAVFLSRAAEVIISVSNLSSLNIKCYVLVPFLLEALNCSSCCCSAGCLSTNFLKCWGCQIISGTCNYIAVLFWVSRGMAGNWCVERRSGLSFCLLLCFSFCRQIKTNIGFQMKMTFSLLTCCLPIFFDRSERFSVVPWLSYRRKMRIDNKILGKSA